MQGEIDVPAAKNAGQNTTEPLMALPDIAVEAGVPSALPAFLRIEVVQKITGRGEKSIRVATYAVSSPSPPLVPTKDDSGEKVSGVQALLWPDGVLRPAGIQPNASENISNVNGVQYPVYLCLNGSNRKYQELRQEGSADRLEGFGPLRDIAPVFFFPPVGWQRINMARHIYTNDAVFRNAVDEISAYAASYVSIPLRDVLYPSASDAEMSASLLQLPQFVQPCLFAVEYAIGRMWTARGCTPWLLLGHSLGEFCAVVFAGALDARTATQLVCERGRLMGEQPAAGTMMSLSLPLSAVERSIQSCGEGVAARVAVGAVNAPAETVITGEWAAVQAVLHALPAATNVRRVQTSHFDHSSILAPVAEKFAERVAQMFRSCPPQPSSSLVISCITGKPMTDAQISSPAYWASHMTRCVRFDLAMKTLLTLCQERQAAHALAAERSWEAYCIEMGSGMLVRFGEAWARMHPTNSCTDTLSSIRFLSTLQRSDVDERLEEGTVRSIEDGQRRLRQVSTAIDTVLEQVRAARLAAFLIDPEACNQGQLSRLAAEAALRCGGELIRK